MTTTLTPVDLVEQATQLAKSGSPDATDTLSSLAGKNRSVLEAARDLVAAHLHAAGDDWDATAALTLLNRTLAELPRKDPLDWRVRWTQRFRRP